MEAYAKTYLYGAKKRLAHCFDYVVNDQKIKGEYFYLVFPNSEYTKLFEMGNPSVIAGLSYEQNAQVMDKAEYRTLKNISSALRCETEDLLS